MKHPGVNYNHSYLMNSFLVLVPVKSSFDNNHKKGKHQNYKWKIKSKIVHFLHCAILCDPC